jgi:hypothetical protein
MHIHAGTHMHTHAQTHTQTHAQIYTLTHTHTHTHTHTLSHFRLKHIHFFLTSHQVKITVSQGDLTQDYSVLKSFPRLKKLHALLFTFPSFPWTLCTNLALRALLRWEKLRVAMFVFLPLSHFLNF